MANLDEKWQKAISQISFAFQPIVSVQNGRVFGFEAYLRNYEACGFSSIDDFFDAAYKDGALYDVDLQLRKIVLTRFCTLKAQFQKSSDSKSAKIEAIKLFYNLDSRILEMIDYRPGNTKELLKEFDMQAYELYFDISERNGMGGYAKIRSILHTYQLQGFKVALDDFGSGHSGLELMYHTEPDVVKLDKSLIRSLSDSSKNRLFCAEIIKLAHIRGCIVVAEGIETKEEFWIFKELGCDLMQGYFIQKPSEKLKDMESPIKQIRDLAAEDKRCEHSDAVLILNQLEQKETVYADESILQIIEKFQKDEKNTLYPVIERDGRPIGLITEGDLRRYIYSPYGLQIIQNQKAAKYVSECPIADVGRSLEDILDMFAKHEEFDGVIITENFQFQGFMSAKSLLSALNEKNLRFAREQNPLTKLPGNIAIDEFINEALFDINGKYALIYFDLDNFKPFNDKFGFRQGDRAIVLFADTVREEFSQIKPFIGHIGGDDFFIGVKIGGESEFKSVEECARVAIKKFSQNAESFYAKEDRKNGFIVAKDRFGIQREFALLTVSAAMVEFSANTQRMNADDMTQLIAKLKKQAKSSPEHLCIWRGEDNM